MGTKTQTTYTMSNVPSFYTNYAQDLLANQQAISSRPYTPYDSSQRVAGFNPTQQQGFGMTQQAATSYQPMLNQSQTALQDAMGRSTTGAMQPLMGQAQTALQDAMGRSSYGVMQPMMGQAQDVLKNAMGRSSYDAASPFIQRAMDTSGLNPAYAALGQAGQSSVSDVGNYMNPYLEHVVNRYGEIGARTLQEKLMPAVTSKYIGAGQLGGPTRAGTGASGAPTGMMTDTARALRDVQEGVAQQQQQALSQGYTEALGASAADKARMATVGGQYASIAQNQQQLMSSLAGQVASMYGQDTANQLAASGQLAQMAQQLASAYGQDTSTRMAGAGQLGQFAQQLASAYGQDTANQMAGAGQLGQLAQQTQQQGLAGASAVTNIGNQQQGLDQAYRDAQYAEHLRASGYDQAQIDAMTRAMQGVSGAIPQGTTSVQTNKAPSSSMFGTAVGGGLTLAGAGGQR